MERAFTSGPAVDEHRHLQAYASPGSLFNPGLSHLRSFGGGGSGLTFVGGPFSFAATGNSRWTP